MRRVSNVWTWNGHASDAICYLQINEQIQMIWTLLAAISVRCRVTLSSAIERQARDARLG
jgi:hypothetical protein